MAKVKLHVWYKVDGTILAVGCPIGDAKVIPLSGQDQSVLETEIEEEHTVQLYRTHTVDAGQKALVNRSDLPKSDQSPISFRPKYQL
jgi:hypothetical protein